MAKHSSLVYPAIPTNIMQISDSYMKAYLKDKGIPDDVKQACKAAKDNAEAEGKSGAQRNYAIAKEFAKYAFPELIKVKVKKEKEPSFADWLDT